MYGALSQYLNIFGTMHHVVKPHIGDPRKKAIIISVKSPKNFQI
jgi:hypothetical protein